MRILAALTLVACTPIYDAQYDDRQAELDEFRTEFLPAETNVQLITGSQDKLYWIDITKPLDKPVLHSFVPSTGARIDYGAWSNTVFTGQPADILEDFVFGSTFIVQCSGGGVRVYDTSTPDTGQLPMQSNQGFRCAVDGELVYYVIDRDIFKWRPRSEAPPTAAFVNLDAAGVGDASVGGLGVIGNTMLVNEGGDLWVVDLTTKQGTYLMNPQLATSGGAFDAKGVIYGSQQGTQYTSFTGDTFSFAGAVADGGYRLNGHYADLEEPSDFDEFVISGSHVVYTATDGTFAYGLESKKTIDLLLNGRFDESTFERNPVYLHPVVVDDTLFVMNDVGFGDGDGQVYRVDLADRLR